MASFGQQSLLKDTLNGSSRRSRSDIVSTSLEALTSESTYPTVTCASTSISQEPIRSWETLTPTHHFFAFRRLLVAAWYFNRNDVPPSMRSTSGSEEKSGNCGRWKPELDELDN